MKAFVDLMRQLVFVVVWLLSPKAAGDTIKAVVGMADRWDGAISSHFPGVLQYSPFVPDYHGASANVSKVLDSLLTGYDKRLRPDYRGPPVGVGISMFVSSISSISEVDMDFTVDFYFRQHWRDPRLAFSADVEDELCISNEMLQQIWWPDTFFANAKDAKFHISTTKNAFLRIKPNGDILHSLRLTVTASCKMDLTYFPMDSQICSLEIESYGYSVKDIKYAWKDGREHSVDISKDVQLPQFSVRGHRLKQRVVQLSTGNYSRLACEFYLVRSLGYYIIQIYVPSILIVVLSWVSFWLSRDAVPARVALGITTVLTMTTLISSTNASLPKISYLKSIDVYLVTCFFMVFASLLEFAAVSYITKRCRSARMYASQHSNQGEVGGTPSQYQGPLDNGNVHSTKAFDTEVQVTNLKRVHTESHLRHATFSRSFSSGTNTPNDAYAATCWNNNSCCSRPSIIDKYSRIMFPLSFIIFNAMYWLIYFNISSSERKETDFLLFEGS